MAPEEQVSVNRRFRATGPDEVRRLMATLRAAFPDATFTLEQRVRDDKGAIAYVWSARGTRSGEVEGYPPTGAPARIVAVTSVVRPTVDESATDESAT